MDFKAVIEPVLKKHGLVAFLINHGWLLIRRKEYIDIYIERQPFNSVEVLFHIGTETIVVRVWGRTIVQKQDADISQEVDQAFSTKPCFGDIVQPNHEAAKFQGHTNILDAPVKRIISEKCLVWSEEEYTKSDSMMPAICQACRNELTVIKNEEILDSFAISKSDVETDVEPGTDADFYTEITETKPILDVLIKDEISQDLEEGVAARYSCKTCNKTYTNKGSWESHAMKFHKGRSCSKCGETFANERLLRTHCDSLKHVMKYKCFYCDDVFLDKGKRKIHMETDHVEPGTEADFYAENAVTKPVLDDTIKSDTYQDLEEGMVTRFSCKTCDKTYTNKGTWKQHGKSQHKERSCSDCGETFAGEKLLQAHCVSLKHVMKYKCFFCDEVFLDKRKRNSHSDTDHVLQVQAMTCDFCDKVFPNDEIRRNHMRTEHSSRYAVSTSARKGTNLFEYMCPLCNEYVATKRKSYWSHLRAVHREDSIDCKTFTCPYTCVGSQLMVVHKLDKHTIDPYDSNNYNNGGQEEQCHCDICGKELTRSQLLLHYKDNHDAIMDGRQYLCLACGINFNSHALREKHRKLVHRHKTTYSCDKCGKQFKGRDKRTLEQHMEKVHMKDSLKKQCQFCKSWLQNAENLAAHVRRAHTGERPFICVYCEESFFSALDLYKHKIYVHPCSWDAEKKRKAWLRENPDKDPSVYKLDCHLCGTLWTTINELRQHWHEVHPTQIDIYVPEKRKSKLITCEVCEAGFSKDTYLQIHTFEKHDIDRTSCPICSEEFPDREGTVKHLMEKHKSIQDKKVMCEQCGHVCSEGNLKLHMRMHDTAFSRPTSCTYCQKEFPKYESMTRHRKIAHREEYNVDRERLMVEEGSKNIGVDKTKYYKKATCAMCGTTLCSRAQLHLHMKARHGTGLPGYGTERGKKRRKCGERTVSPPPT